MSPFLPLLALGPLALSSPAPPGRGAEGPLADFDLDDLTQLSLEELLDIEVTTVSRKAESLSRAPAAVYVLTNEDLRRMGVSSVMEALRVVPGLQVARLNSSQWAISSRGFNGPFANKMLVMVDRRTVYTTLFSGVFWDMQDIPLADVDRIEVIRGPGATLWGVNAVNGVINIITRSSADSTGRLLDTRVGTDDRALGTWRYGMQTGEESWMRFYGRYLNRGESVDSDGNDVGDRWQSGSLGFRADWGTAESENQFTLDARAFSLDATQVTTLPLLDFPFVQTSAQQSRADGGHVRLRWQREIAEDQDLVVQSSYEHNERQGPLGGDARRTFDLDLQYSLQPFESHRVLAGAAFRHVESDVDGTFIYTLDEPSSTLTSLSGFLQDEVELERDRWYLTFGVKLEDSEFVDPELQPSARLTHIASPSTTWWGSISRAVRTPSQVQDQVLLTQAVFPDAMTGLTNLVQIQGNPQLEPEELWAYELGWRWQARENLSLDVAAFYNDYEQLVTLNTQAPVVAPPIATIPLQFQNDGQAEAYGLELAADWRAHEDVRLRANASYLDLDTAAAPTSGDSTLADVPGQNPQHQLGLWASWQPTDELELDAILTWVDDLPSFGIGSYTRADLRLGWRPSPTLELALGVQNALEDQHAEFGAGFFTSAFEIERASYLSLRWRP